METQINEPSLGHVFIFVLGLSLELHDLNNRKGAKLGINSVVGLMAPVINYVFTPGPQREWLPLEITAMVMRM